MKRYYLIYVLLFSILFFSSGINESQSVYADENDYYQKIKTGLSYFQKVYERVQTHYVEEIDPYEFVKAGIDGMLGSLDPYTVFMEEDGDLRLQIITTGKYGGIGIEIGIRNDQITVISPLDNSPAKKAGIRAGDIIEEINGIKTYSLTPEKISQNLRGPLGSEIKISIKRPGFEDSIKMTLIREEIVLEDVTFADFTEPGVAYVRLTGFTEKAGLELRNAIYKLQKIDDIKSFILDLRGNSGGLLESAVEVASIFLPKNTHIVSTRGFRDGENSFNTNSAPILPDIPLAVLVDEGSASASEIVAGALQDIDRSIIVGTKTFGKGLVQKVYNIDKNNSAKIKVTTAKYYIPSGRCVQKQDYIENNETLTSSKNEKLEKDDEHSPFYTNNHRAVFEKGGITPDKFVDDDEIHYIVTELWRQSLSFNFAVQYHREHPEWKGEFKITDSIFNEFVTYTGSKNFQYQIEGEKEINKFIQTAKEQKFSDEVISTGEILLAELNKLKEGDLINHKKEIKKLLLGEFAEKYFGSNEKVRYNLQYDEPLQTAIDVLLNETEYKKILAIN